MRAPIIFRFGNVRRLGNARDPHGGEGGVTMVLVAIAMVAIIAMAAMAIDLVTLFLAREEAQRAADAAALTAARIISVSGITGTASPTTDTPYWQNICGTSGVATLAAQAAGGQNPVGSITPTTVTVTYAGGSGTGSSAADCSTITNAAFAVNPLVTVTVQRTNLPTFFSRIWGITGNSISATAVAEAYNPSASDLNGNGGTSGAVTPVQPRCVKPWMVPNENPVFPSITCPGTGCDPFVSITDGSIRNAGISVNGTVSGVIGETFNLFADCATLGNSGKCALVDSQPMANPNTLNKTYDAPPPPSTQPNLEYVPGLVDGSAVAVPACGNAGTGTNLLYEPAVAGCDQSTQYQCGVQSSGASNPNYVDLTENPGGPTGDTAIGLACSLTGQGSVPLANQDLLDTTAFPFKITAGSGNLLKIPVGTPITASNQIVSLPIYDNTQPGVLGGNPNQPLPVTIVGFLQVFINSIDGTGNINVTVLNVAGCGNGSGGAPNNPVTGSSPVPVRLITPP